jgi:hypothetical protein
MDQPIFYLQAPSVIVNEAMDVLGVPEKIVGDLTDGTDVAESARRNYGQAVRRLLRTAHWDWARKWGTLTLLGDATLTDTSVSPIVECPWSYAYAWPIDAVQGRWMPWQPNGVQPTTSTGLPLTTGGSAPNQYRQTPGRFLVSSSDQYPIEIGSVPWDQLPDLQRTEGLGPTNRKIILTNCCNAHFVYTRLSMVIEEWDSLFRDCIVNMMALALVGVAIKDPKLAMAQRERLIPYLKNAIADARVANGNEAGFPQSTDHLPIWITGRNQGWGAGLGGDGLGQFSGYSYLPWDSSMSWGGSVF